jgi:hypothetical protein
LIAIDAGIQILKIACIDTDQLADQLVNLAHQSRQNAAAARRGTRAARVAAPDD